MANNGNGNGNGNGRGRDKDGLTPKQALFCREYLIDRNGAGAAIRAGGRDLLRRQQLTGIVTRESATFAWIRRVHRRNAAGKTRLDGGLLSDVISASETGSNHCPGRPAPRLIQTPCGLLPEGREDRR